MTSAELAVDYARRLVGRERNDTGKLDPALERVGQKTGLGYWTIWSLWHRRRKTPGDGILDRLRGALIRQLEAEVVALEHEIILLRASGVRPDDDEVLQAETLLARARAALRGGGP